VQSAADRQTLLDRAEQTLREAFRSMASEALQANSQSLTALAQASLEKTNEQVKGDLDRRHAAIADLVRPLADTLQAVDQKLGVVEKDRIAANASLAEQLKQVGSGLTSLQGETGKLVKALRQPHVRGHWGEVQLRQVVELAGMIDRFQPLPGQSSDVALASLRDEFDQRVQDFVQDQKIDALIDEQQRYRLVAQLEVAQRRQGFRT